MGWARVAKKGRQAIGRSRGSLSAKLHALVADERTPLIIGLSPGQTGDAPAGRDLLRRLGSVSGGPALIMDRAYHGDQTRHLATDLGYRPVVPPPSYRNTSWSYDRILYRCRNEVERFFCRLIPLAPIGNVLQRLRKAPRLWAPSPARQPR